ncbi:hypothetical protein [Nocardioides sp.]|uniref:hypothetical protein n=1 Tax=Nocardioides sp. TaxID=35761 RepID=UPI003782F451
MSTSPMTAEEMAESLTGFDEIAIEKHFGIDIYTDSETKGVKALRALVFVDLRRGGKSDDQAKQAAMEMALRDANTYFADDEPELDPEHPETPSGNDSAPSD